MHEFTTGIQTIVTKNSKGST